MQPSQCLVQRVLTKKASTVGSSADEFCLESIVVVVPLSRYFNDRLLLALSL
jgi:hypothetical protein